MGLYKKVVSRKDKNGKWECISCEIEKAPHDLGTWERNRELEKKSDIGEYSYYTIGTTRTGLNKKVDRISSYFNNGNEKVVRQLITTSNKLSQKDREFFKDYKNVNLY